MQRKTLGYLLCALLRANRIPAGMCYQRLTVGGDSPPHCLHGLNAVFLPNHQGEFGLTDIYGKPLPIVVNCLNDFGTWDQVLDHLPDSPAT